MAKGRSITYKYKNYSYSDDVNALLDYDLDKNDKDKIEKILKHYNNLEINRGYQYIIKDLYILTQIHNLTTTQLSDIYLVSSRTIQIWLKELGLNRSLKAAKKAYINNAANSIDINLLDNSKDLNTSDLAIKLGINEKSATNLPPLAMDFLNYLQTIKGKSVNTIAGYKIDLQIFFRFIKIFKGYYIPPNTDFEEILLKDIDIEIIKEIKLSDIYAFLSFVEKNRDNSTYARARKVATLKSFFKYLHGKAKVISENPTVELESPKINKRHPIYLTLDESVELLFSLDKEHKNFYRDYCILTLFLNCGMRLSELCGIKLSKFNEDTLTIIGKGDKERTIYLNAACLKAINNYLKFRDDSKVWEEYKDYLFLSSRNVPINKRTVELLVKKHIKNAGLTEFNYTPHKLRHTAATLMYKHGNVDIRSLQSILGHENIATTQIYTHIDDETLREAVKANPLSNIDN